MSGYQQWEIRVTKATMEHVGNLVAELETLGNEGWEPFHIDEMTPLETPQWVIFSKRPKRRPLYYA